MLLNIRYKLLYLLILLYFFFPYPKKTLLFLKDFAWVHAPQPVIQEVDDLNPNALVLGSNVSRRHCSDPNTHCMLLSFAKDADRGPLCCLGQFATRRRQPCKHARTRQHTQAHPQREERGKAESPFHAHVRNIHEAEVALEHDDYIISAVQYTNVYFDLRCNAPFHLPPPHTHTYTHSAPQLEHASNME